MSKLLSEGRSRSQAGFGSLLSSEVCAAMLFLWLGGSAVVVMKPLIPWYRDVPPALDSLATLAVLSGGFTPLSAAAWASCVLFNRTLRSQSPQLRAPTWMFAFATVAAGTLCLTCLFQVNQYRIAGGLP